MNKWKKRGIYIVPTVHTVGSDGTNFGMGEASIQVYVDGTVLLSYGGVETGQVGLKGPRELEELSLCSMNHIIQYLMFFPPGNGHQDGSGMCQGLGHTRGEDPSDGNQY